MKATSSSKILSIILLGLALSGCRWVDDKNSDDYNKRNEHLSYFQNRQGIRYNVLFSIKEDKEDKEDHEKNFISELDNISSLVKLKHRPIATFNGFKNRIKRDIKKFKRYFIGQGYCNSEVSFSVTKNKKKEHYKVHINITLNKQFKVGKINFEISNKKIALFDNNQEKINDLLNVQSGDPLTLQHIQQGASRLETYFKNHGYPFVKIEKPEILLLKENLLADITFIIKTGPYCKFGKTYIRGLKDLECDFILNRLKWQEGQSYDLRLLDRTKKDLIETGLLSSVQLEPTKKKHKRDSIKNKDQVVDIQGVVFQSPPRRIGAGIRYTKSQGLGAHTYWDHHNLLGSGEYLSVSLKEEKTQTQSKLSYDIPDFYLAQQSLFNELVYNYDKKRAYYGRIWHAGSLLQRKINSLFSAGYGFSLERSKLKKRSNKYLFNSSLAGVPFDFKLDNTKDLFNPTEGLRVSSRITPYSGKINNQKRSFFITNVKLSTYLPLLQNTLGEEKLVLASFFKLGSIFGKNTKHKKQPNVPPNKVFYSGGENSIRSYGYQLLGPLDAHRNPLGGLHYNEFGTEVRFKINQTMGFVIFTEVGSVTNNKALDLKKSSHFWGSGFGLRYYSTFAPIRLDVAFPHKTRRHSNGKKIDAPFQLYLSIGQAF